MTPGKSLKTRLIWQFAMTAALATLLMGVVLAAGAAVWIEREAEKLLEERGRHAISHVENRLSFFLKSLENFRESRLARFGLDGEGPGRPLPAGLMADVKGILGADHAAMVDYMGNVLRGSAGDPGDYRKAVYWRRVLEKGETVVETSENLANIVIVTPVFHDDAPRGALVAWYNIQGLCASALTDKSPFYHRFRFKGELAFSDNFKAGESYLAVAPGAGEAFPLTHGLGLQVEVGLLKSRCRQPVWNMAALTLPLILVFGLIALIPAVRTSRALTEPILK
ncbi:MAG: hypothetical protein GY859_32730, partial [Desulfobacterales bacterium]|nr:hypothetical protein [Desulfobacterales bacterium]